MSDFANSIRPNTIKEIVGQKHLIGLLEQIVKTNHMTSLILYGKPGIGKTSIAYALCNDLGLTYSYFNAASGNKKELETHLNMSDVVIIDEIHRLNKDKQDILLPKLERNKVKIIATTTENPFFSLVAALRSRMHTMELKELSARDIADGIRKTLERKNIKINISDTLLNDIGVESNGDFRFALNSINLIHKLYGDKKITKEIVKTVIPSLHFYSDKNGDSHYNLLSAFHKSLRGSDINASLYYLAMLIKSGDIIGMERRMTMVAYEDIGFADPNVSLRLTAAFENVKKVGLPEGRIILSFAVIDLCKANKSNSAYLAISRANKLIDEKGIFEMPSYLEENHSKKTSKGDNSKTYKYPHDYGGKVDQQYLPDEIKDVVLFEKNKNDKI